MSFSHRSWPPWPPHSQYDRDQMRDRMRDQEHVTEGIHKDLSAFKEQTGRRLTRVEAGVALLLWMWANSKASEVTPAAADMVASILRGWIK